MLGQTALHLQDAKTRAGTVKSSLVQGLSCPQRGRGGEGRHLAGASLQGGHGGGGDLSGRRPLRLPRPPLGCQRIHAVPLPLLRPRA